MMEDVNLGVILLAGLVASGSPGPATMAIAGTSMAQGRRAGLAVASGISAGSLTWSVSAALGLGALMLAHSWMLDLVRYVGAGYLLWLAVKSARSALRARDLPVRAMTGRGRALFGKGMALHITNPKAVLFFGALYSIGIPAGTGWQQLAVVVAAIGVQSTIVFHGYALIFSTPAMTRAYVASRRWFEAGFAVGFGVAGVKILTARIVP